MWILSAFFGVCPTQDVNKDPGAEETFKRIGEAYEVSNAGSSMQQGVSGVWYKVLN